MVKSFSSFLVWQSIITKGEGIFCSKRCRGIKDRKLVILKCGVCGKLIKRAPSRIRLNGNYCSRSCTRKAQKNPNHHTKPELIFEEIYKNNNLPFKYTGDGAFWIHNINPDFVDVDGKKIAIEIFGDYWHSPLLNRNLRENATLSYRKKILKKYGWKLIVFWESDLKRKDAEQFVLNKLRRKEVFHER